VITILVCATIAAPPERVWAAVEHIERHTDWMHDAESITFRSAQHAGVGAEFDCRTRVGPLRTTDRFVVTAWEPGVAMGIAHRGAVTGDGELRLHPRGDGATELCWRERLRFPWWLGGVAGELVAKPVLRRLWRGNLARLQRQIDAGGVSGR
jgi:uncharacterized protein YndB with AHSA1/START domain